MIFKIYKNFSGIFMNLFKYVFDFKSMKRIKKINKKGFINRTGPTWMRRGTQGHVTEPGGPTRAPAWRGGDTCAYLYLLVVYCYSTYKHHDYQNSLALIFFASYIPDLSLSFSLCGTMFHFSF